MVATDRLASLFAAASQGLGLVPSIFEHVDLLDLRGALDSGVCMSSNSDSCRSVVKPPHKDFMLHWAGDFAEQLVTQIELPSWALRLP